jgi:predicted metal-dependent peptidase
MRLRSHHPFFATLALFAPVQITERVDTAATNGREIFFNPDFLKPLSNDEVDGVLLHEVLHAALLHVSRRGTREARRWNLAADIVVNGMVKEQGLALPPGGVQKPEWASRSAEEVYEMLQKNRSSVPSRLMFDLQEGAGGEKATSEKPLSGVSVAELRAHWRMALQQARVIERRAGSGQGSGSSGQGLEWDQLENQQIDWRSELWRYLVQTPVDFEGYDRRFVHRGLYVDQMAGQSLELWVAIDTSGSVGHDELSQFMAELRGIMSAYPNIRCKLFYADAALYGPYDLTADRELPKPHGGGGTSFRPFFTALADCARSEQPYLCVYLTDGYGDFPENEPDVTTVWLVTAGGLPSHEFPFGKVVRLLKE